MDILTHTLSGIIIATPFVVDKPISAVCFVAGCVIPDLDSLTRIFGKSAFMRYHQTITHSLFTILMISILSYFALNFLSADEPIAGLFLGLGMLFHVGLDYSNTYGVAIFSPFIWSRHNLNWIFFIDTGFMTATLLFFVMVLWSVYHQITSLSLISISYLLIIVSYWGIRRLLFYRALGFSLPDTKSIMPSALLLFRYYGYARTNDHVIVYTINALSGNISDKATFEIYDEDFDTWLRKSQNYIIMKKHSKGYHVVKAIRQNGNYKLTCRDLCTRNFGGKFGTLELIYDNDGKLLTETFNV